LLPGIFPCGPADGLAATCFAFFAVDGMPEPPVVRNLDQQASSPVGDAREGPAVTEGAMDVAVSGHPVTAIDYLSFEHKFTR